jgi:hypothetical protein
VVIINIYITVICHVITDIVNISNSLIILHSYTLMKIAIAISPSVISPFITCYQYHTLNRHHAACDEQLKNTTPFPLASATVTETVLRPLESSSTERESHDSQGLFMCRFAKSLSQQILIRILSENRSAAGELYCEYFRGCIVIFIGWTTEGSEF